MASSSATNLRDKVSAMIGQYMMQGYCMLADHCQECGTVMLRRKDNVEVCVLCHEILPQRDTAKRDDNEEITGMPTGSSSNFTSEVTASQQLMTTQNDVISGSDHQTEFIDVQFPSMISTRNALISKITSSTQQLQDNNNQSIEASISLCLLIKASAEALKAINELQISNK